MTFTEGVILGIAGSCLTVIVFGFAMVIYTKNIENEEKKKKQQEEFKKVWND